MNEYPNGYLDYEDFRNLYKFKEIDKDENKMNTTGAYSNVYYIGKNDEFNYIVKRQHGGRKFYNFVKELSILSSIDHPNIIKVLHWTLKNKRFYFSQKYCISIVEYFESYSKNLTYDKMHDIFRQIYSAIKFLHDNNIIHLDIKLENIVYDLKEDKPKIIDFGLSTYGYRYKNGLFSMNNMGYTLSYRDPEYNPYTFNSCMSDYYAMGLCFIRLYFLYYRLRTAKDLPEFIWTAESTANVINYVYEIAKLTSIGKNKEQDLIFKEAIDECIKPLSERDEKMIHEKFGEIYKNLEMIKS
jgi:serine/threonine protein kinase